VGSRLDELVGLSAPWTAARAVTAPTLTEELLKQEQGFLGLGRADRFTVANTLTYLFQHTKVWTLLWAESVAGTAVFKDSRTVRCGVGVEKSKELALTAGLDVMLEADIWFASAAVDLSAEWSKLTQSTVRIDVESEFTRELEFEVPAGGMDIALWQLESRLTRRLILRPGKRLPPDPLPGWAETAIATPIRSIAILTSVTRSMTRTAGLDLIGC
jgi:hypothetical protein